MENDPEFPEMVRRAFGPGSGYVGRLDATTGVIIPPSAEEN
jgi:hypothetical protein